MNFPGQQDVFENRRDAGIQLAAKLLEYEGQDTVVLAIPNGGVPVGLEVATVLKASFDMVIARKIPMPLNPEAGFGAVADDGTIILNDELVKRLGLSAQQISFQVSEVRARISQRSLLYHGERPLTSVTGKTVLIVDDGLASGFTMMAAAESVRRRRPREIVVAVPAASANAVSQVEEIADRVVTCVTAFTPRFAVADFYRYWYDLSDDEVVQQIREWRSRRFHPDYPGKVTDVSDESR
jgi:predicted phosphoribosyltransferase